MDILTPQTLWAGYDPSLLPLETTVVSTTQEEGREVIYAYFNGPTSTDGRARVLAKVVIPCGDGVFPAVVFLTDAHERLKNQSVSRLLDEGYAVILPDYYGRRDDDPRYTIYPESMSDANFNPEALYIAPENIRTCCWIIWAQVAMRAVTFAQSLSRVDSTRVALLGEGLSVTTVIKAAALDSRIRCAVTKFSSGYYLEPGSGDNYLQYKVALMDEAYAPAVKVPLLMMTASNEQDGSIDALCEAFAMIKNPDCRLSISERASHAIGIKQKNNIRHWLRYYLKDEGCIPDAPQLSAYCSEHLLYYSVEAPSGMTDITLFVSEAMSMGALRNWRAVRLESVGENKYIARVDVHYPKSYVYAFVSGMSCGMSVSSPLLQKLPALLGVKGTQVSGKRLIYESAMGTDDWLVLSPLADEDTLAMKRGPFGIEGVSSAACTLSTFKLGDQRYMGRDGYAMQLILCSESPQRVTVTVTALEQQGSEQTSRYAEYHAAFDIVPEDNWLKVTLSAADFKSPQSVCPGWSRVVNLRIDSEKAVAVASILWV